MDCDGLRWIMKDLHGLRLIETDQDGFGWIEMGEPLPD